MNSERKLASIQVVDSITPIEGADNIELVGVLGWRCVATKGEFIVGAPCVYFEIDSFIPISDEFEFLRANSYKHSALMGEGFRLKTQRFKGQWSQGLVMPMNVLPSTFCQVGQDVSEVLGVREWEREEEKDSCGIIIADMPAFLKRTYEFRIQSYPDVISELHGKPYYMSNKIDGTSTTFFKKGVLTGVCGHECQYEFSTYKYQPIAKNIMASLMSQNIISNVAIQGEMAGPGICKNRAGLKEVEFFAFNVMNLDTRTYLNYKDFIAFCKELGIKTVEIIEDGKMFNYTAEQLLEISDGVYVETGRRREGIVVRAQESQYSKALGDDRISFKVLNNKYLLKND